MGELLGLEEVLREMHEREISCGVGTSPAAHISAWIEDCGGLRIAEFTQETIDGERFWPGRPDQIARWLKETADRLYGPPDEAVLMRADRFLLERK
jgi:hypothetical protein